MCGSCSPLQLAVSKEAFVDATSELKHLPRWFASDLFDAVTDPRRGSHLGEATFFALISVAVNRFLAGQRSENHGFGIGFLMPLSAHDTRLDERGIPSARYETAEMDDLLTSFRRVWMAETVREAVTATLASYGLAMPTFACSGIAIVPLAERQAAIDWFRQSGWQTMRARVDQGDRTFGPQDGILTVSTLPHTHDLSGDQGLAIIDAWHYAHAMHELSAADSIKDLRAQSVRRHTPGDISLATNIGSVGGPVAIPA